MMGEPTDRIPTTADGVPFTPGMTLYAGSDFRVPFHKFDTNKSPYNVYTFVNYDGRPHFLLGDIFDFGMLFSTKRAAMEQAISIRRKRIVQLETEIAELLAEAEKL